MVEFQREGLQHFVNMREKSHPPVFVGRQILLRDILTIAETTGKEGVGIPGNTTVIQGAPGAGKSAVLSYLTQLNAHKSEKGPKALAISSVELDDNFPDVLLAIAALGRTNKRKLKSIVQTGVRGLGGLALLDFMNFVDLDLQNLKDLFRTHDIQNIGSLYKAFPAAEWDSPVIVAIDEAQNLPSGRHTTQAKFLRSLHEAVTKLPLTLVLAGLGDTQERIRSMGMTQGVKAQSIGCFTREETDLLTEKWCVHFGIQVGAQRDRIDALIARTDGWPRHVHWAQQALAEALLIEGVDGIADRIPNWEMVQARSRHLRRNYYATQYSDAMAASRKLVGSVMLELAREAQDGRFLKLDEIVALVENFSMGENEPAYRIPKPYDSHGYVNHLIHCGALQRRSMSPDDHTLTCPIPSFQSYIVEMGGLKIPVGVMPRLRKPSDVL
ncbi:MAG: AAA family ATPase [Aestuariivita sp.]|nr:AAA family ATPase [Aestuariivita sp.]